MKINKFYRVFGIYSYCFGGYSDSIILVKKEDKDKIMGLAVSHGNFNRDYLEKLISEGYIFRKITIIKKNTIGWEEIQ